MAKRQTDRAALFVLNDECVNESQKGGQRQDWIIQLWTAQSVEIVDERYRTRRQIFTAQDIKTCNYVKSVAQ